MFEIPECVFMPVPASTITIFAQSLATTEWPCLVTWSTAKIGLMYVCVCVGGGLHACVAFFFLLFLSVILLPAGFGFGVPVYVYACVPVCVCMDMCFS